MTRAAEHPSPLFRSLRPDDEDFQAGTSAAAREAEQRWPLFKAVAPQKQQPTPPLSPQERSLWSTTQKPSGQERRPALSVPATGNKLAQSLNKMGGRPTAATAPSSRARLRTEEEPSYQEPIAAPQKSAREEPARKPGLLFSRTAATAAVQPPVQEPVRKPKLFAREEPAKGRSPLFSKERTTVSAQELAEVPSAPQAGDSLSRLFSRLEGQEQVVEKPVGKRSSLFGRPGKR